MNKIWIQSSDPFMNSTSSRQEEYFEDGTDRSGRWAIKELNTNPQKNPN